ncbi:MAG TPA: hypothetical protein VNZ52_02885 [Candidatus Thermoplasmatota archaeon]|nr:hypothetical protein [Candidatus Thermoplasmatota archaeon]
MPHPSSPASETGSSKGWPHHALLGAVVLCVVAVTYSPHLDWETGERYPYPVHMDEYVHWAYAKATAESGTLDFVSPFTGSPRGNSILEVVHENGFWAILAGFQTATGLDWLLIFEFGPAAVAGLIALLVYCLAERHTGGGLWAAGFIAAIPTTARFLGPGFLVPVVFSLIFTLGALYVAFYLRGPVSLLLLGILVGAAWPVHRVGGFIALLGILAFAAFLFPSDRRRALSIAVLGLLPVVAVLGYIEVVREMGIAPVPVLPVYLQVLTFPLAILYGFGALGLLAITTHRREALARSLTLAIIVLFCLGVWALRIMYERDFLSLYDRSFTVFFLFVAVLAGVGLHTYLDRLSHAWKSMGRGALARHASRPVAAALGLALIVGLTVLSAQANPYGVIPRLLDDQKYADFQWIADYYGEAPGRAIAPGLTVVPLAIVAGKPTAFQVSPGNWRIPSGAEDIYATTGNDTAFLNATGTTIVWSPSPLQNPKLIEVHPRIYFYDRYSTSSAPGSS